MSFIVRQLKSKKAFMSWYKRLQYDEQNADMFANIQEHDRMLADRVRLEPYHQALTKYVKQNDMVIDLGTGTGILSFIAASNAPKRIYALDHSSIMDVAKLIAQQNKIQNIEFVKVNSRDFTLDEKVDVIIHEQIGDFLFEENMIKNVTDLRDRLLKPGGKILPSKCDLYFVPVMIKDEFQTPFIWEQRDIFGIDFSCVKEKCRNMVQDSYYYRGINHYQIEKLLSEGASGFACDLEKIEPNEAPKRISLRHTIDIDGRLDGYAVYFTVNFDDDISFSTHPMGLNTNWAGRLLRVESRNLRKGQHIDFNMNIKDISDPNSWRWSIT